jgi:hypothetical protein
VLRRLPPAVLLLLWAVQLPLPARLELVRREDASLLLPLPLSSDGSQGSTCRTL